MKGCLHRLALVFLLGMVAACTEELTEQDHLDRVQTHEEKGETNAAIIELKNALQKNPQNAESRLRLGTLSYQQGDLAAAEKELNRALKLGVKQARVQIPLGRTWLAQQKFSAVIDMLDPALEASKASRITAQLLRGDALLGAKDFPAARSIYSQLLQTEKHDARVLTGMARIEIVSGNATAAETYLSRALTSEPDNVNARLILGGLKNQRRKYTDSEQHFTHALKLVSSDRLTAWQITARSGLSEALLGQGKVAAAREQIDILLAEIPEHPVPNYLKGYADYQEGDLVNAAEALQKVLRVIPDHPPSLMLLGAVNYGRGNLEQAETYLTRAFAVDDTNVGVRKLLAATRLQLNQPAEALSALSNDSGLLGGDAQILSLSGTARIASGDIQAGLAALEKSVKNNPDDRALRLELAGGYLRTQKTDQALALLEAMPTAATDLHRESLMASAYLAKQQIAKAESLVNQLIRSRPDNARVYFLAGIVDHAAGKPQQAVERFARVVELQPKNAQATINLGRLAFQAEEYVKAQGYFERAHAIDPKDAAAMTLLAYAVQQQGDDVKAVEWLEKARDSDSDALEARLALIRYYLPKRRQEQALAIAQEAARAAPENPLVINTLGVVQMTARDYRNARTSFKTVTRLAPASADAFHNLARVYIAMQDMQRARAALQTSLSLNPGHPLASSTLAVLETRQGHYDKALSIAYQQQKNQPKEANGFVLEGDVHSLNQQPGKAVEAYSKAWQQEKTSQTTLKLFAAQRKANVAGAKKMVTQWLADNPDDTQAKMALALTHHEDGANQQAETLYQDIIAAEPNAVEALNNLAWLYYLDGNKKSIELAERAYQLAPGVGAVTDTLGWILLETGDVQRGVKYLRQADRESPQTPDIQYHLAVGLIKVKHEDEARALLEEALKTDSAFENKGKAEQLLKTLQ